MKLKRVHNSGELYVVNKRGNWYLWKMNLSSNSGKISIEDRIRPIENDEIIMILSQENENYVFVITKNSIGFVDKVILDLL